MPDTRTAPSSPSAPPATGPRRRWHRPWWVPPVPFLVLLAVVLGASGAAAWRDIRKPDDGPRVLRDDTFIAAANDLCARSLPSLRPTATRKEDTSSPTQVADNVQRVATSIAALAAHLRALPVAEADAARVSAWLADWDAYAAAGGRYAQALRAGDRQRWAKVGAEGDAPQLRADRFSRANGMAKCQFYTPVTPPPGAGGVT